MPDACARPGAAAGESLAHNLPVVPSRVAPLAGRVLGGTACAVQSLAERRASDIGARVGGLGAIAGSVVGYTARTRLRRVLPCQACS